MPSQKQIIANGRAIEAKLPCSLEEFLLAQTLLPRSVVVVTAERVYTHCPRALIRSKIWDATNHVDENALPSHGTMMKAIQESFPGEEWDRNYPQRIKETMY